MCPKSLSASPVSNEITNSLSELSPETTTPQVLNYGGMAKAAKPINSGFITPIGQALKSSWSAKELIEMAAKEPPEPIIDGLLIKRDIMLLHGVEESFKSIFILQLAECIATGIPLLGRWSVPRPCRTGVIETEMHPKMLGKRLASMFSDSRVPDGLFFMDDDFLKSWRRANLKAKVDLIDRWLKENRGEVSAII